MSVVDIVGRSRELESLERIVDAACSGRGGICLVSGEPGIGKSTLVGLLADDATARGAQPVWGRCWESGGAPAFWPWIEIVREVLASLPPEEARASLGAQAGVLASLVPEAAAFGDAAEVPMLEARQAQFRLFDAVASFLKRAARPKALLLLLEDLHAADSASVALLDFVARSASGSRLAIVGTYRVAEARAAGILSDLARPGRAAQSLDLAPLDRPAVADLVRRVTGGEPDEAMVSKVFDASEGNPLFAVELARLLRGRDGEIARVPLQVAAVIGERVRRLPPDTAELLRRLSVLGREMTHVDASELAELDGAELGARLAPAVEGGLIAQPTPSTHRFTHTLIREVLHHELDSVLRSALHRRIADALAERHRGDPNAPLTRIAHHYRESGPEQAEATIRYSVRAAERALTILAHAEAAELYDQALHLLDAAMPDDSTQRAALLLSKGHALLLSGEIARGEEACRDAARLARGLGSPELLARAALEYGAKFTFGQVDPELVALLEEALRALGDDHGALRARVLARLAAAKQPALDPIPPMEMAREAIALARSLDDDRTLLAVVRSAVSALMDYAEPSERIAINREHVALARKLDEPVEVLRGHARLFFDCLEIGDADGFHAAAADYARVAESLDHPSFLWISEAFQALLATLAGRFADARAHRARALELGARSGDPNAAHSLAIQGYAIARITFDDEGLAAFATKSLEVGHLVAREVMHATFFVGAGQYDRAEESLVGVDRLRWAASSDPHLGTAAAEVAAALGDGELAAALYRSLLSFQDRNVSWGMVGLHCDGSVEHWLGLLSWTFGDEAKASAHFDRAAARTAALRAPPLVARTHYEHGRRLADAPEPERRARGLALLARAREIAESHGMEGLVRRIDALGDGPAAAPERVVRVAAEAPSPAPSFQREGDVWAIAFSERTVRIKSTKGIEILARLVAEPGREHHALDLAGSSRAAAQGSMGERIDDEARRAYQRRARDLREELEEASEWNDTGRAARARAELEALEAELAGALGLGGRAREAGDDAERARVNVQKRIRAAQKRIAEHHPSLAEHLGRTVRTGTYCSYEPLPAP